ncbi:SDR family NAD(P)-dependent oxidoreductase [Streptoalloteichus hindustanus]|uniref:Short-chain dehydrogenase n=1 Tax=Streptoalloteichus hindustanus TaxID=2017 RepID=A0A1M4YQW1_STRHI|nr:SDR family NAD(P)-dependent oxidoreductase [Streptoalloteichus hindustanus]SHF08150.1 Short-chain dehydrogenase [Streptoalloteichus hindustanus]
MFPLRAPLLLALRRHVRLPRVVAWLDRARDSLQWTDDRLAHRDELTTLLRAAIGVVWLPPDERRLRAAVDGRVVLVTGASSGIGRATACRLAAAGATVLLVARRRDRLDAVRAEILRAGGAAHVYQADLADASAVELLVRRVLVDHGHVDVVVSNAGKSARRPREARADRQPDLARTMNVNYLGPVRLLLGLLPAMRARGRGQVVNVGTVGVDLPMPYWSAYLAAKAAFESWLRAVSAEARADGVTTTTIRFPLVRTAMSARTRFLRWLPGMAPAEAADAVCRAIVRRPRLMSPWWARLGSFLFTVARGPRDDFGWSSAVAVRRG